MPDPVAAYRGQSRRFFFLLLFAWFMLNMVQALFTEIGNDESYYWVYSRIMAWGYFDHPPLVALLIRIGTWLAGDTTLGVRLLVILMQMLFLWVLNRLTQSDLSRRNILLFFLVSFSVVMLQVYGFVATPDAPLLFFTVLFLWSYQYFLGSDYSLTGAVLMALCMAGLMYSKYHGALVILFVICSNLRLFTKRSFLLALLLAVTLYLPHILWQVNHDFPSLKYHLVNRSKGFRWSYLPDFLVNQLPVFNPFTLGAAVYVFFHRKENGLFERALRFLFAGFILFFLFWNLRGRVEPHWTIAAAVPMVILIVREATVNSKLRRYLYRVVTPSLGLILLARVFLIADILPISTEWHGDRQRVADLEAIAGDRPVLFISGFQLSSKYRFYTGKEAHTMGALNYRNTQYDLWKFDESYWDEPVLIDLRSDTTVVAPTRSGSSLFNLIEVDQYQPYKRLKVTPQLTGSSFVIGRENVITVRVMNPYSRRYVIDHSSMPLKISLLFLVKDEEGRYRREQIDSSSTFDSYAIAPGEMITGEIRFELPRKLSPGAYDVYFAASTPGVYPATLEKPVQIFFE